MTSESPVKKILCPAPGCGTRGIKLMPDPKNEKALIMHCATGLSCPCTEKHSGEKGKDEKCPHIHGHLRCFRCYSKEFSAGFETAGTRYLICDAEGCPKAFEFYMGCGGRDTRELPKGERDYKCKECSQASSPLSVSQPKDY